METKPKHFILVHGMSHGAWCWYKLATLLEAAGHRVTAPDLAACGTSTRQITEIESFADYCQPLFEAVEAVPPEEKVVLVGHSLGGSCIALAMEKYPEKVSLAVFVAAAMPSEALPLSKLGEQFWKENPMDQMMDSSFSLDPEKPLITFGPTFLATKIYQLCSLEDLTLARMLLRQGSTFNSEQAKEGILSKQRYGSIDRVFIMCKEDQVVRLEFQNWMVENSPDAQVKEIEGADHMAMLSRPGELFSLLMEVTATTSTQQPLLARG